MLEKHPLDLAVLKRTSGLSISLAHVRKETNVRWNVNEFDHTIHVEPGCFAGLSKMPSINLSLETHEPRRCYTHSVNDKIT